MAFQVSRAAMGMSTMELTHMPGQGPKAPEITSFSVLKETMWKMRKKTMAITAGAPMPPT